MTSAADRSEQHLSRCHCLPLWTIKASAIESQVRVLLSCQSSTDMRRNSQRRKAIKAFSAGEPSEQAGPQTHYLCYLLRIPHKGPCLSPGPHGEGLYSLSRWHDFAQAVVAFGFSRKHKLLVYVECHEGVVNHIEKLPEGMQR